MPFLARLRRGLGAWLGRGTSRAPVPPSDAAVLATPPASLAATALAYRQDAARHLYGLNVARIHQGMLPPLLHAIGVLDVEIDTAGRVRALQWRRAPRHAPEVVREIERTVHAAAPFPPPQRLGRVIYTDTWLWDASGCFQLDTLTEGQRGDEDEGERQAPG